MRIKAKLVRVYGTLDQYGDKPHSTPAGSPFQLPDFPTISDISWVHFGAVPDEVLDAYRARRAIGSLYMGFLAPPNESSGRSPIERIEDLRKQPQAAFPIDSAKWFTTIIIEREVDIDEADLTARPYYWLEVSAVDRLEAQLLQELNTHMERLASLVAAIVQPGLLSTLVHSGLYFSAPGRETFSEPKLSGSATLSLKNPIESFPATEFADALKRFGSVEQQANARLDSVRHWLLAARQEKDAWKKFLWSFLALEILARKMGRQFYAEVLANLKVSNVSDGGELVVAELIPAMDRLTLVASFAITAAALSSETAAVDIADFKIAKSVRDGMSHGSIRSDTPLPPTATDQLLQKYFSLAIRYMLKERRQV